MENKKMNIKKDDTVVVISGNDKGKRGKVVATSPKEGKVIVQGVHIVHKHEKPKRQGDAGGIIDVEGAIYASKVQLWCPKCGKGVRIKHKLTEDKDGKQKKVRVCAKCGEEL